MPLLIGPRLGPPSTSGFTVWARFDNATSPIEFAIRRTGAPSWTVVSTSTADAAYLNTITFAATGLDSRTSYDYQLTENGVVVASSMTMTLPASGRFVAYHIGDAHGVTLQGSFNRALIDWQTNYEPLAIPAFILQTGDLISVGNPFVDADTTATLDSFSDINEIVAATSRLPLAVIFDDFDWMGDQSAYDKPTGKQAEGERLQAILWRDRPRHAPPSYAYSFVVAGVPFIVTDQHSRKQYGTLIGTAQLPSWRGDEDPRIVGYRLHGEEQAAWLVDRLIEYGSRALVVYISSGTFKDGISTQSTSASAPRDGLSLYYKGEQAAIARRVMDAGYVYRNNLVVWGGDDHRCRVYDWTMRDVHAYRITGPGGLPLQLRFREFKASSVSLPTNGTNVFGQGNIFEDTNLGVAQHAIVRWDITSHDDGARVSARATYIRDDTGVTLTGFAATDPLSTPFAGDFYFDNGRWSRYVAGVSGTQLYPPENSPSSGVTFARSYLDDVTGALHREYDLARDHEGRLRDVDDIGGPDRDTMLRRWRPRVDRDPPLI